MVFVGVDLHKQNTTFVVVDAARKQRARKRFDNDKPELMTAWLANFRPFQLVVEATASYEWFVQLVEPLAERVLLAHPGKLRIIAESTRKSDNLDARVLAEMLALDQIPVSYRPTPRQREHRTYVRHRDYLSRQSSQRQVKIRRLLANHNLDEKPLFSAAGLKRLAELALPAADRFCIEQLLAQWRSLHQQLDEVDAKLKEFAAQGAESEHEDRKLLRSIPGVGPVTSEVVLSELADWQRFSSQKKVIAYAGLAPGQRESAGKRKALHIEKTGSPLLRWVLVQAAWQLKRRSALWNAIFESLRERVGKKKAIVALARRLLGLCYALLRTRRPYSERELARQAA